MERKQLVFAAFFRGFRQGFPLFGGHAVPGMDQLRAVVIRSGNEVALLARGFDFVVRHFLHALNFAQLRPRLFAATRHRQSGGSDNAG